MTIADAAVMGFHARQKRFTDRLEEAITPPVDPFTGKTLGYRKEPNGFVIYSAGPTGKFAGGAPGMKREGREAYYRYPPLPPQPAQPAPKTFP